MFRKAVPLLPAKNIRESIDFYEAKLGFNGLNFGNYAILTLRNSEIHLFMITDPSFNQSAGCVILVDNIEDLYTHFSTRGLLHKNGQLKDSPWGFREFSITDNNNNLIRFAQKR